MANQVQETDDDKHWIELGKRVNDPEAATIIVNFLDGYPALRAKHSGLYLLAAEVVHRARVQALLDAMQSRKSYRLAKFLGRAVSFAYRCLRLGVRAARTGVAEIRKVQEQAGGYNRSTVVYPSGKPSQPKQEWQAREKLSNLIYLFRQGTCGKCGTPVGSLQERCDECGHILKAPGAVGQAPVQA